MLGTRRREAERRQRTPLREMDGRAAGAAAASGPARGGAADGGGEKREGEAAPGARVLRGVPAAGARRGCSAARAPRARRCVRFSDARLAPHPTHTRHATQLQIVMVGQARDTCGHRREWRRGARRGSEAQRQGRAGAAPSRRAVQSS
jgi:hypothetical protein